MKYFKLTILCLSLYALSACTKDEAWQEEQGKVAVQFSSVVLNEEGQPESRAAGTNWSMNDEIGIFMKKAGEDLSTSNIVNQASNILYFTEYGDGFFAPKQPTEDIRFPELDAVDFIAYYPYTSNVTDYKYPVNVSDQSDLEAIDLLYANNLTGIDKSTPQVKLQFKHALSCIKFNISPSNPGSDLSGLSITLKGLPTEANLDLKDGSLSIVQFSVADINVQVSADGTKAEAIVLPVGIQSFDVTFTLNGTSVTETINDMELAKGRGETRNVTITGI